LTRIQVQFPLKHPLNETLLGCIRDAQAIYGIESIVVDESGAQLTVNYDATRLKPIEVAAALRRRGIPIPEPLA
jgi:hypothetical protein